MCHMRMCCYSSFADDHTREQIWRLIYGQGWISDRYDHIAFYIPEDLVCWALLIDPTLERRSKDDYIV